MQSGNRRPFEGCKGGNQEISSIRAKSTHGGGRGWFVTNKYRTPTPLSVFRAKPKVIGEFF